TVMTCYVVTGIRMDVERGLATRAVKCRGRNLRDRHIDIEKGVAARLLCECGQRLGQRAIAAAERPQAQDVAAQVGDGHVEAVDRAEDALARGVRMAVRSSGACR